MGKQLGNEIDAAMLVQDNIDDGDLQLFDNLYGFPEGTDVIKSVSPKLSLIDSATETSPHSDTLLRILLLLLLKIMTK